MLSVFDVLYRYKNPENSFKTTQNKFYVVPFAEYPCYNKLIKTKEVLNMNTDKIYAETIANEYAPKKASKVIALKKLDRKAKNPAQIFAYTFGIIAALLLGVGMCLSMSVIGNGLAAFKALGIIIGLIGLAGASVNYPIYKKLLQLGKEKYASDIIRLASEISNDVN
jgi:hypothetical protein